MTIVTIFIYLGYSGDHFQYSVSDGARLMVGEEDEATVRVGKQLAREACVQGVSPSVKYLFNVNWSLVTIFAYVYKFI